MWQGTQINDSCSVEFADYHSLQARGAIPLATWEQRRANIAQTIDVLPDFRAEVREGWSCYIESTYGTGESVGSSAVHDTETLVDSDDVEAPGAQARFCYLFQLSQLYWFSQLFWLF